MCQFVYERRSFRRLTIPAPLVYVRALKYVILFSLYSFTLNIGVLLFSIKRQRKAKGRSRMSKLVTDNTVHMKQTEDEQSDNTIQKI